MQLPAQLSRNKSNVYKTSFGHILIIAGSQQMLGAGALSALAALRSGAGLVTFAVPKSLNAIAQKKVNNCVMTLPLRETDNQSISLSAYSQLKNKLEKYSAIALGPGLSRDPSTKRFVLKLISNCTKPIVIDADALFAIAGHLQCLKSINSVKILTPHPGEMKQLINRPIKSIEKSRKSTADEFAKKYRCTLLLKGHRTVVASPGKRIYINKTGNTGMATAGCGDVLTGMIAAFLGQGLQGHEAAKFGSYLHGKAGDLAVKSISHISMIASDIIDFIPAAIKKG